MTSEFIRGGLASICSISLVHPIDVVKSRTQFLGEGNGNNKAIPKSTMRFLVQIFKQEGFRALYRGISAAYGLQFSVTATRFGFYSIFKNYNNDRGKSEGVIVQYSWLRNFILAGISGGLGGLAGSPWFLIKTRMQVYSTSNELKVGTQRNYASLGNAFVDIYRQEGFLGFFRGVDAFVPRVMVYGAAQLSTYDHVKNFLHTNKAALPDVVNDNVFLQQVISSVSASIASVVAIQPFDFVAVRLQNQPVDPVSKKGLFYSSFFDCLNKSIRNEGIFCLFKGFKPNILRFTPYTFFVLIFVEQFRKF